MKLVALLFVGVFLRQENDYQPFPTFKTQPPAVNFQPSDIRAQPANIGVQPPNAGVQPQAPSNSARTHVQAILITQLLIEV